MTPDEILNRLTELVTEEGKAIAALQTARIVALSEEKEVLVTELAQAWPTCGATARHRLGALVRALRHNCVLLAHARSCVRDAIESLTGKGASYGPTGRVRLGSRRRSYLAE
ncbi:MAG: hypothetical protein HY908_35340 [Myxococcales bacterium]|nr:hypothetical protein [Myxococcales bacterium]